MRKDFGIKEDTIEHLDIEKIIKTANNVLSVELNPIEFTIMLSLVENANVLRSVSNEICHRKEDDASIEELMKLSGELDKMMAIMKGLNKD